MDNIKEKTKDPDFNGKKEKLKGLLRSLKDEKDPEKLKSVKSRFKDLLSTADPIMIVLAESELIGDGYSQDDLVTACDAHLELFRDAIEHPDLTVPEGHAIALFQNDHRVILGLMERLVRTVQTMTTRTDYAGAEEEIVLAEQVMNKLLESENHNVRQENTLFPVLERHGVDSPPAIMWSEHLDMKSQKKKLLATLRDRTKFPFPEYAGLLYGMARMLLDKFGAHTQKEQNILYAVALDVITDAEWKEIKEECDELGYFNADSLLLQHQER
jgi:uncharacterized protein